MEKIKDSMVNVPMPYPKLVNPVTQEIGFRTAKFVANFGESFDSNNALVLSLALKLVHPRQQGN